MANTVEPGDGPVSRRAGGHVAKAFDAGAACQSLLVAAGTRVSRPTIKGWTNGWSVEDYRRSGDAAIDAPSGGSVRLEGDGVAYFEDAVGLLERQPGASQWDTPDLWAVTASLLAAVPDDSVGPARQLAFIRDGVNQILAIEKTLVMFAVANATWNGPSVSLGPYFVGSVGAELRELIEKASRHRLPDEAPTRLWWLESPDPGSSGPVAFAALARAKGERAFRLASTALEEMISLALVLHPKPQDLIQHGPVGAHRPGVRGLRFHRPSLSHSTDDALRRETGASVLRIDGIGTHVTTHWYSDGDLPLDRLVGESRPDLLGKMLLGSQHVADRVRTASRWYADYFWAEDAADQVLALGVSLDALLGSGRGADVIERYALLGADRSLRAERFRRMREMWDARNAIAHGDVTVASVDTARRMESAVREVVRLLLHLEHSTRLDTRKAFDSAFEALRWGTIEPPADPMSE